MNDADRAQWVDNDEALYRWWTDHRPRLSKAAFVQQYRAELTTIINQTVRGQRQVSAPIDYPPSRQ